jgi:mannose-6-phosphate isomerase-like protein (cupin superfamily)
MAKLFTRDQLPHFDSTRDTRDRMDLLTDNVPVGATRLRADRIIYHPGDTCAKHYHIGCHHLFVVLEGEGLIYGVDGSYRLKPGMVAAVAPEEIHWFENDTGDNFKFVEFWAPPPLETIWIVEDDI